MKNMTVNNLGTEAFTSQKIRKYFAFCGQKLSRIGQRSFFHEHGLWRVSKFSFLQENLQERQ